MLFQQFTDFLVHFHPLKRTGCFNAGMKTAGISMVKRLFASVARFSTELSAVVSGADFWGRFSAKETFLLIVVTPLRITPKARLVGH